MSAVTVDPVRDLYRELNAVEQPGRYVGGEFGCVRKPGRDHYRVALSFPDLYEIGMSNTAIKLLYRMLNAREKIACERVFVPAPDFEEALYRRAVSLYTLETGTPLYQCDMLAVSFSYELLATNLVTLLRSGGIPVKAAERDRTMPLVLIGGPGATNPVPYGRFIDGAWQGEAEEGFVELVEELAELKLRGAHRDDLLERLRRERSIWYPGRPDRARRAIWNGFPWSDGSEAPGALFPVPSIPVVQDHGVVEIMRGCPQGCRFCHAGVYYRPYRMKPIQAIEREVDHLVNVLGYREISLSSLSSGDYGPLQELMSVLNRSYASRGVSLQLPSLRVESFTLPLLEQLNTVRRAGLTFAVESAGEEHQRWTNKLVPIDKVTQIARQAKERGWRRAKLYFMIGLPGPDAGTEWERIMEYARTLRRAVPMEYVINVGTFVPKPHTPFQWEPQLSPERALEIFREMRRDVPKGVSLRYHDPWMSWLEGVLTRGDERVGEVIERAHAGGARLDAWTDYLKIDVWREAVASVHGADRGLHAFTRDEPLPWENIHSGIPKKLLLRERDKAHAGELSERCLPECADRCGVCNDRTTVHHISGELDETTPARSDMPRRAEPARILDRNTPGRGHQLLLKYSKRGKAAFLPHLAMVRTFERFWNRIGLPLEISAGHHPKPKMSFGQPLPTGVESDYEVAVVNLQNSVRIETVCRLISRLGALPEGVSIDAVLTMSHLHGAPRILAPMQVYSGSVFNVTPVDQEEANLFFSCCANNGGTVTETPDDNGARLVDLPAGAWGLGRILKESSTRGAVRIRRISMYAGDKSLKMMEWYDRNVEGSVRRTISCVKSE